MPVAQMGDCTLQICQVAGLIHVLKSNLPRLTSSGCHSTGLAAARQDGSGSADVGMDDSLSKMSSRTVTPNNSIGKVCPVQTCSRMTRSIDQCRCSVIAPNATIP